MTPSRDDEASECNAAHQRTRHARGVTIFEGDEPVLSPALAHRHLLVALPQVGGVASPGQPGVVHQALHKNELRSEQNGKQNGEVQRGTAHCNGADNIHGQRDVLQLRRSACECSTTKEPPSDGPALQRSKLQRGQVAFIHGCGRTQTCLPIFDSRALFCVACSRLGGGSGRRAAGLLVYAYCGRIRVQKNVKIEGGSCNAHMNTGWQ